ncbi:MAG: HDOD domain-containing protein [Myxococcota bacterium]
MKRRILFVDDEPHILEGLRNRLRRKRKVWEMFFANGGDEALALLGDQPVDVIVSDMRMPRMDGATLLERVQKQHPGIVRIVLSGHAELESALRVVPVAHQFLTKPCEVGLLENVVERACNLHQLINDDVVRRALGGVQSLPSLPRVYAELQSILQDEDVSAQRVAEVLKQDVGMCAKLLQMVNSAFFRLPRPIAKVEEAVMYLGFTTIKQVVLTAAVFSSASSGGAPATLDIEALQRHSVLTGRLASELFQDRKMQDEAFCAGLLHDVGKLVVATQLPERAAQVADVVRAEGTTVHAAEQTAFGVTHAEVGGYLLGLWGLPYRIVEAVANHHAIERVEQREFDLLSATYVANALANEQTPSALRRAKPAFDPLDLDYLERMGVSDQLESWREKAATYAETVASAWQKGGAAR